MRLSLPVSSLFILLIALPLWATEQKRTDARNNGLVGPVRSVSTQEGQPLFSFDQRNFPVIIGPIACQECEFDRWGTMIKSGNKSEGEFRGETFRITRDEAGHVIEQVRIDAQGQIVGKDRFGPYGVTEHTEFQEGKPSFRSVWEYDTNGHMLELVQSHGDEQNLTRTVRQSDSTGNIKEDWSYGKNAAFSYHILDTYDPATDIWTWTSFNEDGSLKIAIVTQNGKVLSYQHPTMEENAWGEHFFLDPIERTQHTFRGHPDGTYDDVTTIFPDDTRHNPGQLEWRDGTGVLRLAVDFQYEVDSYGNWIKRSIWVWTPELSERRLYKTDMRLLTYWN